MLGNYIFKSLALALKLEVYIISLIFGLLVGFFLNNLVIISISSLVTVLGGGVAGFSLITLSLKTSIDDAKNGFCKVHSSYRITPKDHTSLFSV
jgi:hypothetical protein